jgi:hypothetical protein
MRVNYHVRKWLITRVAHYWGSWLIADEGRCNTDHVTPVDAEYLDGTSASLVRPFLSHLVLRPRRRPTALTASLSSVLPALPALPVLLVCAACAACSACGVALFLRNLRPFVVK